jgi:hypothetical protein
MLIFFGYIYLTTQVVYVDVFNFFLECCLYVEDRELLRDRLDIYLSLVCRTFNTLQPYKSYLGGVNKLTSFISEFLKLHTVGKLLILGVRVFQSLIEEGKNELRYISNLVILN